MNNGGDAAEQIVRLSLEGFEVAVRLTGSAAKNIAILLASVLKQEISQSNKTRGKARLTNMIKSGKELKVFSFQQKDLPKFTEQAKRVRKYGAYATGITQNVDDLLQSHTARTMLANSEFIIMLNQSSTDRIELGRLLNISDLQMSYITNVEAGHGLIKVGSSLVPFANKFPKNTKLYKLMTTKPGESA